MVQKVYDTRGYFNACNRVAGTHGLTLEEEEGIDQPRTDMNTGVVYVPVLDPMCTEEELVIWLGKVYHEVGHHHKKLKDIMTLMEDRKIGWGSLTGKLVNVVEDIRNEFTDIGLYPGRDKSLNDLNSWACREGVEVLKSEGQTDKDRKLFCNALGMSYHYRKQVQKGLTHLADEFNDLTDKQFIHLAPMCDKLETAEDVWAIVEKMLDESPDHDKKEEMKKAAQAKANEGKRGKGKGEGKGELSKETQEFVDKLLADSHSETKERGSTYVSSCYTDPYIPAKDVIDSKPEPDINDHAKFGYSDMCKYYWQGKVLSSTARRLFQSRVQRRLEHNRKRGKLDKRDLYRIPSGAIDVFTRKSEIVDVKETAVYLLVDQSGSMKARNKYNIAAASAALLVEAIQPLGIPVKVSTFTTKSYSLYHSIIKDWNEHTKGHDILALFNGSGSDRMASNADGDSIMWAASSLRQRRERRKLLIVVSDGMPAARAGDIEKYTEQVVAYLNTQIEVYGIGLLTNAVRQFYPHYTVLDDPSKLESLLLTLIKEKIFKI